MQEWVFFQKYNERKEVIYIEAGHPHCRNGISLRGFMSEWRWSGRPNRYHEAALFGEQNLFYEVALLGQRDSIMK